MTTARKFSVEEQRKLFALLELPFEPAEIKWRVIRKAQRGRRGLVLPYADPRAYTDRLNQLFTPAGWSRTYALSTVSNISRRYEGRTITTGKVLVNCVLELLRLGSHSGNGEEWADQECAATSAEAQAFKRACSCFGLGRYLYRISERWVDLDHRGQPVKVPKLPLWALPPTTDGTYATDPRGPIDQKVTVRIESFRPRLGDGVFTEILFRAGHSHDPKMIPNATRQKLVLEWMEAAERGFEKVRKLAAEVGAEHLEAILASLKLQSVEQTPSLEALRFLVDTLESITPQQVA